MTRVVAVLLTIGLAACSPQQEQTAQAGTDTAPNATDAPGTFTREQFGQLDFLQGDWRGTMPDGKSFYEHYRMTSDTSLKMYAYPDSTMTNPTDSTRIYWSDGHIYSGEAGSRSVVARIDGDGVHFVPDGPGGYRYTWKQSGNGWTATLSAGAENTVVYEMKPLK